MSVESSIITIIGGGCIWNSPPLSSLAFDASVVLIGSGLTAIDVVLSLF